MLEEMMEAQASKAIDEARAAVEKATDTEQNPAPADPEKIKEAHNTLITHLAAEAELAWRRDCVRTEFQALEAKLEEHRNKRAALLQNLLALGGEPPSFVV